jgi:hypothetical protein
MFPTILDLILFGFLEFCIVHFFVRFLLCFKVVNPYVRGFKKLQPLHNCFIY